MTTHLSRREIHPRSTARKAAWRLRRLAVALTAATCGLLASALIIPAASARTMMLPGPGGAATVPSTPPSANLGVVPGGGMAGWQIALIAAGAALVAAIAAVALDRTRAARKAASATAMTRPVWP